MGKTGFIDSGADPYVYIEIAGGNSCAIGLDNTDSGNLKITLDATAGATPSGTAKWVMTSTGARTIPLQPLFVADYLEESNVSGDGTVHAIGSVTPLDEHVDVGNNFFPGDGAGNGATFTAPVTGIYLISFGISSRIGIPAGGVDQRTILSSSSGTSITIGNYPTSNRIANLYGAGFVYLWTGTTFIPMTAGDILQFQFISSGGAKVDSVNGINSALNSTESWISGCLYD
jgi:hypothetical protein